jgi:glycosyltransferase involved in cell wall biosynthesis
MPDRPLVSVITPTWQRPGLLAETIEHVREQTYRPLEHIIVSDGWDSSAKQEVTAADLNQLPLYGSVVSRGRVVYLRYHELGRNWSGLAPDSFGVAPLTVGYLLARGEYLLPWCDDERALTPDHIERLVGALEAHGADFAYPKVQIWRAGHPDGPETAVIGTDPPEYCQITHYLFRAANLHRFGFPRWGSHPVDWSLVSDWMARGAIWAHVPMVTFSHRLDQ